VVGVASSIVLVPRLGAATTVALNITGQMLASLALDAFGWLGVPQQPLSATRVLGAITVLLGSALITFRFRRRRSDQLSPTESTTASREPPFVLGAAIALALAAGVVGPTQSAINARLRAGLDAPMLAALVSFTVGLIPLLILVLSFRPHRPNIAKIRQEPWWIWVGGILGAFYVASTVVIVPEIGTAALIGFVVAGQNLASMTMDHFGLIRLPRRAATPPRIVGVLILLAGVLLIQFG
jgi:transporter family-2 protein